MALTHGAPEYEAARKQFWAERFAIGSSLLDRAEERGEVRPGVDRLLAFETLIGPLHVRRLLTREPLDDGFLEGVIDLILAGIAAERPPAQK
jgi:AcrR family transcriptional regulator